MKDLNLRHHIVQQDLKIDGLVIKKGWTILKVDGKCVTPDDFQSLIHTKAIFTVSFQVTQTFFRIL